MSILIASWDFEGPFDHPSQFKDDPGVYALLCETDGEYELIDMRESRSVKDCITFDEEHIFAQETCNGKLVIAVYYTGDLTGSQRLEMKKQIESEFDMLATV